MLCWVFSQLLIPQSTFEKIQKSNAEMNVYPLMTGQLHTPSQRTKKKQKIECRPPCCPECLYSFTTQLDSHPARHWNRRHKRKQNWMFHRKWRQKRRTSWMFRWIFTPSSILKKKTKTNVEVNVCWISSQLHFPARILKRDKNQMSCHMFAECLASFTSKRNVKVRDIPNVELM
jgi:hypothetical protein